MVVFNIHNAKQPQLSQSIRTLHLSKPRVRHHVPPCPMVWLRHAEGRSCSMAILLKPRFQLVHFLTLHHLHATFPGHAGQSRSEFIYYLVFEAFLSLAASLI